jgi:hypothetical protein
MNLPQTQGDGARRLRRFTAQHCTARPKHLGAFLSDNELNQIGILI